MTQRELRRGRWMLSLYHNSRYGIGLWHGTCLFDCSINAGEISRLIRTALRRSP